MAGILCEDDRNRGLCPLDEGSDVHGHYQRLDGIRIIQEATPCLRQEF
jgi:hypothetical protein